MTNTAIVLTPFGDPNGIGPEIVMRAAMSKDEDLPRLLLVGDVEVAKHYSRGREVRVIAAPELPPAEPNVIDLVAVDGIDAANFLPGQCNAASGRATISYLSAAVEVSRKYPVHAIVAGPHNETAIAQAGISFSGYPPLLAALTGTPEDQVFLMLAGGGLRIVHATLHERLYNALERLTPDLVSNAIVAAGDAIRLLGVGRPRIGVFGINPHAGEQGLFGDDDERVTVPAVRKLLQQGLDIVGPTGADLLLLSNDCDVYVAMYHDQGHIPIKLIAKRECAGFTIGIGTSFATVGHGSAPDIAGKSQADPEPFIAVLKSVAQPMRSTRAALT